MFREVRPFGQTSVTEGRPLAEIHTAPRWLWPALVEHYAAVNPTLDRLRALVKDLAGAADPSAEFDRKAIAGRLVAQTMKPTEVARMNAVIADAPGQFVKAALALIFLRLCRRIGRRNVGFNHFARAMPILFGPALRPTLQFP